MIDHFVSKMTNFCVAYMDVAGGVPMRGVSICPWMVRSGVPGSRTMQEQLSRSGSLVKLSNSHARAGSMSAANALAVANALGLACVSRLDLDEFESQSDSIRINQGFLRLKNAAGSRNHGVPVKRMITGHRGDSISRGPVPAPILIACASTHLERPGQSNLIAVHRLPHRATVAAR
jgi:hypothetical protein